MLTVLPYIMWDRSITDRWEVAELTSKKTCVYKPNPVASDLKRVSFGGLFASNFRKVPRNKVASLVWEAWFLLSKHRCLFVLLGGNSKLLAFHAI